VNEPARYRVLHDHAAEATLATTTAGVIEAVSPSVTSVLGWAPEHLRGRTPFEFVHSDDLVWARRAHEDLNRGLAVQATMRMRTSAGTYEWVVAKLSPILDGDGEVIGRLGVLRRLDHEQRLRLVMADQEAAFRYLMDQTADIVVYTTDGVVTWVSASLERVTGWRPDEVIGTPSWQWVHPDDRGSLNELRVRRRPDDPASAHFRMLHRDGRVVWFEVLSSSVPSAEKGGAAVSVMRDVTARVEAEATSDALAHRLAATLDTMFEPHAYMRPVYDEAGQVVDLEFEEVNDAECRYLDRPRHDIVGHRVSELLPRHMKGGILDRAREVLTTGRAFAADGLRSWNDILGEHRLYDISVIHVDGVLSMWHRDVTQRYAQFSDEARLRSLEALQSERERLARDLHDGAIQKVFATSMQLAALAAQLPEPSRVRLEHLIDLQDAVIRDLRTTVFELGTTGRTRTSPGRSVHDTAAAAARVLGFDPRVTVDDDLMSLGATTLGHLLAVLSEALSNVARHARAGQVEVDVRLIGSDVVLDVWDDGVGLPTDPRRGDGLRNMRRRAQLLGGECEMVSRPGEGTEVIWRVPVDAS